MSCFEGGVNLLFVLLKEMGRLNFRDEVLALFFVPVNKQFYGR